jgi:hypothetical protein
MTNRYPSELELTFIKEFDIIKKPITELLDFVYSIWEYDDWGFKKTPHAFELHTGGWSGNEDIISALKQNFLFWSLYWEHSSRGGHYYFDDKNVAGELKLTW